MSEQEMQSIEERDQTALELTQAPNSIFRRALFGGYKTVDVDHYVERAAEVLESLIDENKEYRLRLDEIDQREGEMRTALESALKFTDQIVATAQREVSSLREGSAERTEEYVETEQPTSLAGEIEALRAQRDRFAAELNAALDSHIRMLSAVETGAMTELSRARVNTLLEGAQESAA